MELDKEAQEAVRQLGAAINKSIEKSTDVTRAIEYLRVLGYEPNLTLKLEIALQEIGGRSVDFSRIEPNENNENIEDIELELTDEDLRTLRRMKIRIE